jgi:hypothetical protein
MWLGWNFFSLIWILSLPTRLLLRFLLEKPNERLLALLNSLQQSTTASRSISMIEKTFDLNFNELKTKGRVEHFINYTILAIFYAVGLYETTIMSVELYKQYSTNHTQSSITFINNTTMVFPLSTICLPINLSNVALNGTEERKFQNQASAEKLLLSYNDKASLLNDEWSPSFLQLIFEYLALYTQIERFSENVISKGNYTYGTVYGSFFGNWTALKNFDNRVRFLNITAEELKQKCGQEVRKTYTIEVSHFNDYNQVQHNNTRSGIFNSTTFIGKSIICFSLRLDLQSFSSQYEYLSIVVKRPDFFYNSEQQENVSLAIDLSGRDNSLNQTDIFGGSTLAAYFGQQNKLGITITAIYKAISYSNGKHKCSGDTTLDDCQVDI